ncbi:MAG: RlmE family RNA methyltransferase [Pseudomonadota bacterium]
MVAHNAATESSKRWIERQLSDPYVRRAREAGYRSRAAFKLLEVCERSRVELSGRHVVDLGCAPGGWLQVCVAAGAASVAGIDLLETEPLPGAHIVRGDIASALDVAALKAGMPAPPDLVLSDMAANTTGHRQTDHLRTIALVELALGFAEAELAAGGTFVSKVFQGGAVRSVLQRLKRQFAAVKHVKPPSSRASSPEVFVVAKGFRR